jgi:PAS domain S-box-containing protein
MKSQVSLKTMLTLNFILAATIPLLIIGLLMLYILTVRMIAEIENKNFLLAKSLTGEIERFLEEPFGLLRQIDHVVNIRRLIADDQMNSYLDAMITNYAFFEMLMIIDHAGKVRYLAPYDADFLHNDMSGQGFFYIPHENGQPYWSPSFISFNTGNPTLTLSLPFNDGILVGYLNLATLKGIIAKVKISPRGYACVTDRDGTVIADPDQTKVSQRLNIGHLKFVQQGLSGDEGTFRYRVEGTEELSSVVIVPQTHWLVAVNQPIADAYASVRRIRNILLAGSSAAIILAISIALISLRITLCPLSQLTEHTRRIAAGAYHIVPQGTHYQEVDELTYDFNQMVDAIKNREHALRESEEKLRTVFQAAVDVSFIITDARDPEPTILEFSPGAENIFGYARSEMIGHPVSILHLPKDVPKFPEAHRQMREGQQGFRGETTLVRKSGEQFPALFSTYPLFDSHGQMYAALGVSIDITEQKRAEKELQNHRAHLEDLIKGRTTELAEERNLLRTLIDNIPDLILVKDVESRFLAINPALARLMGAATPEELLGKTDFDFYPQDIAQQYYTQEQAMLASGHPSLNQEELHIDPETGAPRLYLATKIPFRDQQGVIRGLVGISRDITEHKQIEEELRHHRDHLEELVKKRTAELTAVNTHLRQEIAERKHAEEAVQTLNIELEQRVQQRTAQLEAMNKELQSFAYVVSHDLKAPLRGISHLANWLIQDYAVAIDDQGKEMLDLLSTRVKRMDNLIDGILEYSRIGRVMSKAEPIDLHTLLRDVLDTLSPLPTIQVELAHEFPVIVGDKIRIAQVFQNLIGNAIKFMDKPQGEVNVGCVDAGDDWQFNVTDNGPGIDSKHHEKIFQIFQTLHPRDEQESTGIGLSIVKKIVEFYGGKVWVESEPGTGSTFWFTLPKVSPP